MILYQPGQRRHFGKERVSPRSERNYRSQLFWPRFGSLIFVNLPIARGLNKKVHTFDSIGHDQVSSV